MSPDAMGSVVLLDIIVVIAPFILAGWLTGWPGKRERIAVKYAGLSFLLFGVTTLLRLVIFGRHMPAGKYTMRLMTTEQDLRLSLLFVCAGFAVMLVHHLFLRSKPC